MMSSVFLHWPFQYYLIMRCSSRNRRHRSGSSNLYQSITLDTAVRPCNVIKRPISAKPARNVTASPEVSIRMNFKRRLSHLGLDYCLET